MKLVLTIVLIFFYAFSALATQVEGRVVLGTEPLAGMQVRAYKDLDPSGTAVAESEMTGQDGLYKIQIPEGFFALYARSADGKYFAFCGRNPLRAQGDVLWAGLQAVEVHPEEQTAYDDEYTAALEGVVSIAGATVADAYVSLYLDAAEDLKGQGYRLSAPTGEDGTFMFDGLPESDYFLVVRKRRNGARVGPLSEGDALGVFAGNPISLKAGQLTRVMVPLVVRQPNDQGENIPDRPGTISLTGRVIDGTGQPRAGLHVFAYRDAVIGHQRPAALSPPTGVEGRFLLSFRDPGVYYVGARQFYGDSPAPGELFGLYEGSANHGLTVTSGKNSPIEITVLPISID